MTSRGLIALTALALAGCASVGDLQEKGAAQTFSSTKPASTVYECITAGWNDIKVAGSPTTIRQQRVGETFRVINGQSSVVEMAEVKSAGQGSAISFYRAKGLADWRERRFTNAINPCL